MMMIVTRMSVPVLYSKRTIDQSIKQPLHVDTVTQFSNRPITDIVH